MRIICFYKKGINYIFSKINCFAVLIETYLWRKYYYATICNHHWEKLTLLTRSSMRKHYTRKMLFYSLVKFEKCDLFPSYRSMFIILNLWRGHERVIWIRLNTYSYARLFNVRFLLYFIYDQFELFNVSWRIWFHHEIDISTVYTNNGPPFTSHQFHRALTSRLWNKTNW